MIEDDLLARAQEAAPRVDTVLIEDGVRVGNRVIWALLGGETVGLGGKDYQLVCCTESGAATDLTRFIDLKRGLLFVQLGRDARGRIWLAWLDRRIATHGAVRGLPRILQLDPSTLAPRTKALAIPGVIADKIKLACAASCRLVAESAAGDIVSWAPGESSPTRVASGWKFRTGNALLTLLAASYRSGHLVVAYQGAYGKTQFFDASVRQEIRIVRADARGAHGRVVGTIPVANTWPPDKVTSEIASPFVYGTFTPLGLVVIESFQFTPSIVGQSPVPYAIVPVTR